jgi:hypothetical protein
LLTKHLNKLWFHSHYFLQLHQQDQRYLC